MPDIFSYLDYRDYLRDYYQAKKRVQPGFSFQVMADKAGFKSKSFIKLVIDGRKKLSEDSVERIGKAIGLAEKPFSYFKDLVAFNQALSLSQRNYFFERLTTYNKRNPSRIVLQHQYEFYSKWYHNTMRELVTMVDFKDDYSLLGSLVKPAVSARQARQSVMLLTRLGLIKRSGTLYVQTDALVSTGDEVQSLAVQNFHLQNMMLAGESIDTVPGAQRDVSCLVLGLSERGFASVKSEIQAFRKKLLKIAQQDTAPSRVYHVNFQAFPTSGAPAGQPGGEE